MDRELARQAEATGVTPSNPPSKFVDNPPGLLCCLTTPQERQAEAAGVSLDNCPRKYHCIDVDRPIMSALQK
jgi:hypothetical protein